MIDFLKVEPMKIEDLYEEILKITYRIPEGRRTSYGLIAEALGDKIASRAVGEVLSRNPRPGRPPRGIPCHRVLYSDGRIGKYAFGSELKKILLLQEGVEIEGDKALGEPRKPDRIGILERRKEEQRRVRKAAEESSSREIESFRGYILGLDASYKRSRLYDYAISVAVLMNPLGEIEDAVFTITLAKVPYIPTYLAYRELPAYKPLAEYFIDKADLIAVNGHGLAHPRAGIASHLGYLLDKPSIGVAKKLLRNTQAIKIGKRYLSPGYKSKIYPEAIKAIEKADKLTKLLLREFS